MNIPDNLIDVEHENNGYIEDPEGEMTFGASWPDGLKVFHKSEWKDRKREMERHGITARKYLQPYNNQNPESSCVYNATEVCLRYVRNRQLGLRYEIKCSPMSGYCRVARSRHSGSTMWGAMQEATEYGFLPESSSKYMIPGLKELHERSKALAKHTFHQNSPFARESQLPSGWKETAKHFRVLEWVRIDSEEHFASALLHGYPICYGRSGHSIAACDLVFDDRGNPLAEYLDSYGPSRGDDGRLFDSRRMWATGGAWACMSVTIPNDPANPCGNDGTELAMDLDKARELFPAIA